MKTSSNTLASLLAAAIWADGEFAEVERVTAEEIADAFEIPQKDFHKYNRRYGGGAESHS